MLRFFRVLLLRLLRKPGETAGSGSQDEDGKSDAASRNLLRIIRREFPSQNPTEIQAILDEYGVASWQRERVRVQLAILKLSLGDLERLQDEVDIACTDYRDVVGPAEYPEFSRKALHGAVHPDAEEMRRIELRDAQQYQEWLDSP